MNLRDSLGLLLAFSGSMLVTNIQAQCSTTQATSCVCRTAGQTNCDLKPDITLSWFGLQNYNNGPSEYAQNHSSNGGRLRISGSTPNIGYGPLEVRTADQAGLRRFVCGTDTFSVSSGQQNFICPNGENPKQIIYQQVYRKQGSQMIKNERTAGSMTYHFAHNHYHVNDWTTMNLAMEDPNESDPRKWPVLATGAKIGFCLMDYGACSTYPGHCRTSQEYGGGTAINSSSNYPNYGMNGNYNCGTNVQGISVGRTDIYSKSLDMMWINMMDGLCNGNYWIVAEVDPTNVFVEENDENNWTAIPYTLTQQRPAGSGGTATILAEDGLKLKAGGMLKLTATPGYSYAWSNGANTRTIEVTAPGNYSVTVTAPCGNLVSGTVAVSAQTTLAAPVVQDVMVLDGTSATLNATGTDVHWYDSPVGGQLLGAGGQLTTDPLYANTSYWAESHSTIGGETTFGARTDRSSAPNANSSRQHLIFNAYEPFEIKSVKVYATGNGDRHFVMVDNVGNLLDERYVYVRDGEQRVELNFKVPVGTGHRITAFDDNTEIVLNLHRDNSGVSYPYQLGTMGAITGSTAGPAYYYYLYDWELRTPELQLVSERAEVLAQVSLGVALDAKVFLGGAYDPATGLMRDDLRVAGLLPGNEPYSGLGYTFIPGGSTTAAPGLFDVEGEEAIVDWMLVELRDATDPTIRRATSVGLVQRNGRLVSVDGAEMRFRVLPGSYFVVFKHRNHLGFMTATALQLSDTPTLLDMTQSSSATWGLEAHRVAGTTRVMWSGNAITDDRLKYTGAMNDRDPLLSRVGGTVPTGTMQGYFAEDINLDGLVRYTGANNDRDPILSNIGGVVPTQIRFQQLP